MNSDENIEKLFHRFLEDKCTSDEIRLLLQYFDAGNNEKLLRSLINKQSERVGDTPFSSESLHSLLDNTYKKIQSAISDNVEPHEVSLVPLYRRFWVRVSAAAAIIFFMLLTGTYFLRQKDQNIIVQQRHSIQPIKDIPPGTKNATLTLDNGKTIVLDSAANGTLTRLGNIKVLKINGQIAYDKTGKLELNTKPVYNTVSTARGNQYQVVLADGSKVWLNAASSIRFPSYFTGNDRKVEITGEAYFEVAKDASKPFSVQFISRSGEKGEIQVLGTHFNLNAYPDEQDIKTTLLEGSVKIKRGNSSQILTPGQQANINSDAITIKKNIVVSDVIAWKDGFFVFDNTNLKMIMRQVARWYDVEVNFEGKIPEEGYTGKVSRNLPLSGFLKMLELNDVNVRAEGRKITIGP
ncbi:MAG: FecR domain-containing protein [Ginsengibacter sp.]